MSLITDEERKLLLRNGRFNSIRRAQGEFEIDFKPVVKLGIPQTIWLLSELDPDRPDLAFGLYDKGYGLPEICPFSVAEIESHVGPSGPLVVRDTTFVPVMSVRQYAEDKHRRALAEGRP